MTRGAPGWIFFVPAAGPGRRDICLPVPAGISLLFHFQCCEVLTKFYKIFVQSGRAEECSSHIAASLLNKSRSRDTKNMLNYIMLSVMVFGANRAPVRMQWLHGINIIHYLQEMSIRKIPTIVIKPRNYDSAYVQYRTFFAWSFIYLF